MLENITDYELFLFDLDGCLIDSEKIHYASYKNALDFFNINLKFHYDDYVKLCHSSDSTFKDYIKTYTNYEDYHKKKEEIFESLVSKNSVCFTEGAENFLKYLMENNKKICVVTNSSSKRISLIKKSIPFLNKIEFWISKNDCLNPKPSPECYIKAIQRFDVPFDKIIAFEDSYKGFIALKHIPVTKLLIQQEDYFFYNDMICDNKYKNFNEIKTITANCCSFNTKNKLSTYTNQINAFSDSIGNIVNMLTPLIMSCKGSIYLCGIGKSNHVCNKSVSTWQSMGIHANKLLVQDLSHGDFGVFKDNDIIIYITNSGNTEELSNVADYIKNNFKLLQISISNNTNNSIKNYTNLDFVLGEEKIIEADTINMAPSVSSVLFMMLLDLIGINVAEMTGLTKEDFKKFHPGGSLGSKI